MANTAEGLSVGSEDGLDPNNPTDFAKIMEGRGVVKTDEDTDSVDRSIAAGLTTDGPDRQPGRDPETGKFVSNQETKETAPVTPPAATDTPVTGVEGDFADPAIQEFLQKYGGNVEEALKGAANAQTLIGKRDERADTLEKELAEMKGKLEGFMAAGARPAGPALTEEQIADVAATRVEALGYEGAATEAANVAHQQGDERPLQKVLEQWNLESPFAAMNFLTEFRLWQREEAASKEAPEQPAWMQTAAEQVAIDSITKVISAVAEERSVSHDSPIIAQMLPALETMPKNIVDMVNSNDPEAAAEGVRLVMDRATILAGSQAKTAAEKAPTDPVARKLAGAAVASGALRPAPAAPSAPTNRDDAIKEFKRQIVEAPTTSISSGLTYGPTP